MNQSTVVLYRPNVPASDDRAMISVLAVALAESGSIPDADAFAGAVWERESQQRTWLGREAALPHARLPAVHNLAVAIGTHAAGIEWGAPEHRARLFFLVAVPRNATVDYLYLTQRITRTLRDGTRRKALLDATDPESLASAWQVHS